MTTTSTDLSPATTTAYLLGRLDRYRRVVEQSARLKFADLRLMWLLTDGVPRTLREVGEALSLEQSTVNRQVNAALASGLLERSHAQGRGAAVVTATATGIARFQADRELFEGLNAAGLAALDDAERDVFLALLDRFTTAYAEAVRAHPDVELHHT